MFTAEFFSILSSFFVGAAFAALLMGEHAPYSLYKEWIMGFIFVIWIFSTITWILRGVKRAIEKIKK